MKEIEVEIKQTKEKGDEEFLTRAMTLLNQAEAENQEVLQREQELLREKQAVEEKINELKNDLLD